MTNQVQEIKNRLDVVEVIRGYLRLEKAGINFKGTCPFHSEKSPSFFVSPTKQMWYCFGCNRGGDIFAFVQAIDSIDFPEALKLLAERAGVQLKKEDPKVQSMRIRTHAVTEAAADFFERQLEYSDIAKTYLKNRGLTEETIKKFRLGWAPEGWSNCSAHLQKEGFKPAEIFQAGLGIQSAKPEHAGKVFDRFRGRVMFPIFDHQGRVAGFTGRILKDSEKEPKYLNTPNTPIYDKGKILFGFHEAKNAIRERNEVILVEGNMDFLMCWQAGDKNVVASSGTALSADHLMVLRRLCSNLLSAFDMDEAGQAATKRSIDLALNQGFQVKVIQLGNEVKDPADLIAKDSTQWHAKVAEARPIMDYFFEKTFSAFDAQAPEGKKNIAGELLPEIKKLSSKIEKAHWMSVLSDRLKIKESVLEEELNALKNPLSSAFTGKPPVTELAKKPKLEMLMERALFLLGRTTLHASLVSILDGVSLPSSLAGQVFGKAIALPNISRENIKAALTPHEAEFFEFVLFKNEMIESNNDADSEFEFCLRSIAHLLLKDQLQGLTWQMKEAERLGNVQQVEELSQKAALVGNRLAELLKE